FLITIPFSIFSIVQAKLDFIPICLYFFATLLGGIIFTSIRVIVAMLNFFSESPYGFERVWIALRSFIEYPRHVFPPPVRFVLTFLIPVLMVASIPAEVVKTNSFCLLALLAVFCTGLVILTCFLWRVCLRQYASASS
ncbi:MAG: ABC-2 family transporter protein, partial [Deltaproteobacteria bacterium]|nr:ABC-2 family transporter protein [Deltaproteobacteria bacterium]